MSLIESFFLIIRLYTKIQFHKQKISHSNSYLNSFTVVLNLKNAAQIQIHLLLNFEVASQIQIYQKFKIQI